MDSINLSFDSPHRAGLGSLLSLHSPIGQPTAGSLGTALGTLGGYDAGDGLFS